MVFSVLFGSTPIKKFNTPVWKPMAPFAAAAFIVFCGVWKLQDKLLLSEEWINHPENQYRPRVRKDH